MDHRYYVGPVGRLRALPDRLTDVASTLALLGGTFTSLGGTQTVHLQGVKHSWAWSWNDLLPQETRTANALREHLVPGPLRLLNPREPNRLPAQVASGGSQRRSPAGFAWTTGTARFRGWADIPVAPTAVPDAGLVKGGIEWTVPAGGGRLYPSWPDTLGRWLLPLLPGEQVALSAYLTVSDPVNARWVWPEHRSTGIVEKAGTPRALEAGRWRRLSRTVVPGGGAAALTPMLEVDGATTVHTTLWQAKVPGADELPPTISQHCDPIDDTVDVWYAGGGAPHVQVTGGDATYKLAPLQNLALALVEA